MLGARLERKPLPKSLRAALEIEADGLADGLAAKIVEDQSIIQSRLKAKLEAEQKRNAEVEIARLANEKQSHVSEEKLRGEGFHADEPRSDEPVLDPKAPYIIAGEFIHRRCMENGSCVLWSWRGKFYRWSSRIYEVVTDDLMRGQLWDFLHNARRRMGTTLIPFNPDSRAVSGVLDALRARLSLPDECQPPMWLANREPAYNWIVFNNAIVNTETEETRRLSPDLWAHNALGFDWNPDAECPIWRKFLVDIFPGDGANGEDEESVNFIEEWIGLNMTDVVRFQKGALFIGLKRSGKSTISNVMKALVGESSFVGVSFNKITEGKNSEVLIGKRCAVFNDVRFKPGKFYGQNYDAGGIDYKSAELLLTITGADTVTLGQMYTTSWHGQLRVKVTLISNEIPNLNDGGGVLPSRFIKVAFNQSFYGREDVHLWDKLQRELPGIAVQCIRAYRDLCDRGEFIQPKSVARLERDVLIESDPSNIAVTTCFAPDFAGTTTRPKMVDVVQTYLRDIGRPDLAMKLRTNNIMKHVRAVSGFEHVDELMKPHAGTRLIGGLRVIPKNQRKE